MSLSAVPTGLAQDLQALSGVDVRLDDQARSAWSTDASNYRRIPWAVVLPHTPDAMEQILAVCRRHDAPLVARGGGTSLAGQSTNEAVMVDFSRYCTRLVSVDAQRRTCVVEPGIVLDSLNRQLRPWGLRFGPEPATHMNCTLGGMIGNNSCGATAQRDGKVSDNIRSLEVMLYDGTTFTCGPTDDATYREIERRGDRQAAIYRSLRTLRDRDAELVRARFPAIPRRISGYSLDALLPESGFDIARLLVGTEGTLATVLRAELDLVEVVAHSAVALIGFDDIVAAARAVPELLRYEPIALEGLDHYLLRDERVRHMNLEALDRLPDGHGFLLAEFEGHSPHDANRRAQMAVDGLRRHGGVVDASVYADAGEQHEIWSVREAGLGATAHQPDTWPGWEDSAVAPERVADYLSQLQDLFVEFGYVSEAGPSVYGHFGQGCIHVSIPFDLLTAAGVAEYRRFVERAADLVSAFGGSLSGEHGDGQARGELLDRMFGADVVDLFKEVKYAFDPQGRMNPDRVVDPAPLDRNLRLGSQWRPQEPGDLRFAFAADGGSFTAAARRCVGVGKCRVDRPGGGVMCPSYQVTREEQHSTRGRSRLLFEMLDGHPDGLLKDGWRSEAVRDALDLCLACKGCKTDCPAGVDMATYKAEFLDHHYAHRLRPRADYATGWLPEMARWVRRTHTPSLVNAVSGSRIARRVLTAAAGLEDRSLPRFAERSFQEWFGWQRSSEPGSRGTVTLWPDTFTNSFTPEIGQAAMEVLQRAGWGVDVPTESVCCGLTWISTGQLRQAKRRLSDAVETLVPRVRRSERIVVLEPSCASVLRSDAWELLGNRPDVKAVSDATVTLAELLSESSGWEPPQHPALQGRRALAQVHCHQHAVLGWDADHDLLARMGVEPTRLDSGCCGLAGNFGMTRGHGAVSEACAEQGLLPAVRAARGQDLVLADGFSCRKQIADLAPGHRGFHLVEVLAAAYSEDPDAALAARPPRE